jgi:tRNA(Ile)-lysidine synthase
MLIRPLLGLPKTRLIATLEHAKIAFADDPSNRDPRFTRARLRGVMPVLAREGLDARALALLARRLRRAEAAIDAAVGAAAAELSRQPWSDRGPLVFDAEKFGRLPAEVALRLLGRAIAHTGDEGPVELRKLESLHEALSGALLGADAGAKRASVRLRRTLAGALVTLTGASLAVERAPARGTRHVRTALTTGR